MSDSDSDCASLLRELNTIVANLRHTKNRTMTERERTATCLKEIKELVDEIVADAEKLHINTTS